MPPFAAKDGIFCIIAYRDVIPFNIPSSHQGSKIKAKDIIKRQKYRYLVKPTERTESTIPYIYIPDTFPVVPCRL